MSKSGFPYRAAEGLDPELTKYLDEQLSPAAAVSDLSASPTNAEIANAFNALLSSLRAASKMDT
jgi:hypothetical protein